MQKAKSSTLTGAQTVADCYFQQIEASNGNGKSKRHNVAGKVIALCWCGVGIAFSFVVLFLSL